jgi:hypothetical protein
MAHFCVSQPDWKVLAEMSPVVLEVAETELDPIKERAGRMARMGKYILKKYREGSREGGSKVCTSRGRTIKWLSAGQWVLFLSDLVPMLFKTAWPFQVPCGISVLVSNW